MKAHGHVVWSYDFGSPYGGFGTPVIGEDGTVYCDLGRRICAVSHGGKLCWSFSRADLNFFESPVLAADGTIYIASWSGLVALSSNGQFKWLFKTAGRCGQPALSDDGTVFCGSQSGVLYAVSREGRVRWSKDFDGPIHAPPAIDSAGRIYFGSKDSSFYCVNHNGNVAWRYRATWKNDTALTLGPDATVYAPSLDGILYALTTGGKLRWTFNSKGSSLQTPVSLGPSGLIYLVGSDRSGFVLDSHGKLVRKFPALYGCAVSVAGDGSACEAQAGSVKAFAADGSPLWTFPITDKHTDTIQNQPSIGRDGVVYLLTDFGVLYATD